MLLEMWQTRTDSDGFIYSSCISACVQSEQWLQALCMLTGMQQEHFTPGVVCYSAAISACDIGEHWQKAMDILAEMRQAELDPNVLCYCAAVCACAKGEPNMDPDGVLGYVAAITASERGEQWRLALGFMSDKQRAFCWRRGKHV